MSAPRVLVLRTAGTNCDLETAHAFLLAGAEVETLHVQSLLLGHRKLSEFGILAIPGGFSYGDDLGAGTVLANQLRTRLAGDLADFVERGRLVIGICNGFQVLVRLGILPGAISPPPGGAGSPSGEASSERAAALVENASGRFEGRWTRVRVETGISPFLEKGKVLDLPVAHKEGRFVVRDPAMLAALERNGQVALRYLEAERDEPARSYPANPSGSSAAIAGIANASGNVLGLMPHPERHLRALNHPSWTRKAAVGGLPADEERAGDGYPLFARAVAHL
jgi:phosphoribosylformylglycinamidine synthase